jgi:Patatin-like phospholipase
MTGQRSEDQKEPVDKGGRENKTAEWIVRKEIQDEICQRATSLNLSVEDYLKHIHKSDSILQIDRGIFAIVMAWTPLWLLMIALAFSPQGKDLLVRVTSDSQAAVLFVAMLIVLCGIAAWGASALVAAWLYPRLGFGRPSLYRPRIPKEATPLSPDEMRDVISAAEGPILLAIGIPIAGLATAAFVPLEWRIKPLLIFLISLVIVLFMIRGVVRWAAGAVLHLVAWSFILLLVGFFGLMVVGFMPAYLNFHIPTEVLIVAVAILWLFVFFGFTFMIYGSRHSAVSRYVPSFLGQHWKLITIGVCLLVAAFVKTKFWPEELPLMRAVDAARSSSSRGSALPIPRRSLEDALKAFRELHEKEDRPPLVLVTAAGGGIRAAYWSAAVLSKLQDQQKAFANHVFAISAVSGGALGSSAFKALATLGIPKCPEEQTYAICTARFLGRDFIGPNIVAAATGGPLGFLSLGVMNRVLVPRDKALEDAWSLQWTNVVPEAPRFDGAFDDLFVNAPFPALLLNGTSTVSGDRVITSNLDVETFKEKRTSQITAAAIDSDKTFKDCKLEEIVNPAGHLRLSVSSAILTSARFPYITPPGLLELKGSCRHLEEIMDGGFIDNEGIVTMREVLHTLVHLSGGPEKLANSFRLIVIRLSVEPSPIVVSREKTFVRIQGDNLNPLYLTAMTQRAAAGRNLVSEFRNEVESIGGTWVEFNALDDDAPLGWTLSERSRRRLTSWLDGPSSLQRAELNLELPKEERAIIQNFARLTDMPGRIKIVLSQFDDLGATK